MSTYHCDKCGQDREFKGPEEISKHIKICSGKTNKVYKSNLAKTLSRSFVYFIPQIPESFNKYAGRHNHWEYRAEKKKWEDLVGYAIDKEPGKPLESAVVTICYHFPDDRRRDPDNFHGKFINDGLVKHGIIKDDSFKHIQLILNARFKSDKPGTEIIVVER